MSAQELVLVNNKTPSSVASELLSVIKDIEVCIEGSNNQVSTIENRDIFESAFSSTSKDLIDISRSQNKINDMMLGLIQEVITLNTMSYSFLAAVISEMDQLSRSGWVDSEGRFQELSDTGRQFADRANEIFVKILDGSRSTHSKIEVNQKDIEDLRENLQHKAVQVEQHGLEIVSILSTLEEKAHRLSKLDDLLEQKMQTLEEHDKAIQALVKERQENNRMDMVREQTVQDIQGQIAILTKRTHDTTVTLMAQKAEHDQQTASLRKAMEEVEQRLQEQNSKFENAQAAFSRHTGQFRVFMIGLSVTWLALAGVTALNILKLL